MSAENVRDDKAKGVTTPLGFQRVEGVEGVPPQALITPPPSHDPVEAFALHFFRCFFCRVGDRLINDYFCEQGRELLVGVLDLWAEKALA